MPNAACFPQTPSPRPNSRNLPSVTCRCYSRASRRSVPFHIRQRVDLADYARHFPLKAQRPTLVLEGLLTGVDNLRHDVILSPKLVTAARAHLSRLIATFGAVQDLTSEFFFLMIRRPPRST